MRKLPFQIIADYLKQTFSKHWIYHKTWISSRNSWS